jgi:hypothetical protein
VSRVRGLRGQLAEPKHCVCEGVAISHPEHTKPRRSAGAHLNPACPHSTLLQTTSGARAPRTKRVPGTRGVTVIDE